MRVTSDGALGNTSAAAGPVGQVELNGGTLQTGALFAAPERNLFLGGGSQIDVDGFTTSWGSITDVQRTLEILNSNTTTAGAITFSSLTISSTATLQLAGGTVRRDGDLHQRDRPNRPVGHADHQPVERDLAGDDGEGVLQRRIGHPDRRDRAGVDRHQQRRQQ